VPDTDPQVAVRAATLDDCEQLWRWRNDPVTRGASFHGDEIPLDHHRRWLMAKLADTNSRLFVGTDASGEPIGSVRFDLRGAIAEVSVVVAAEQRGRRLSSPLLAAACDAVFSGTAEQTIVALIRAGNSRSVASFARAGFLPAGSEAVGSEIAIRMTRERTR
jgi:RimJ/RimL family protein N-acetyltransferase